jgi:hypothetical protein
MENQVPPPLPPQPTSPPPIYITTPPARRSGRGWMVLSLVLLAVLGLMVFGRVFSAFLGSGQNMTGTESGRHFEEITVESPTSRDKIAVVPVE